MDEDKYLNTYYTDGKKGFKCIGLITHPAVILEDVKTGERETHVIGCLNYNQLKHLVEDKY